MITYFNKCQKHDQYTFWSIHCEIDDFYDTLVELSNRYLCSFQDTYCTHYPRICSLTPDSISTSFFFLVWMLYESIQVHSYHQSIQILCHQVQIQWLIQFQILYGNRIQGLCWCIWVPSYSEILKTLSMKWTK